MFSTMNSGSSARWEAEIIRSTSSHFLSSDMNCFETARQLPPCLESLLQLMIGQIKRTITKGAADYGKGRGTSSIPHF